MCEMDGSLISRFEFLSEGYLTNCLHRWGLLSLVIKALQKVLESTSKREIWMKPAGFDEGSVKCVSQGIFGRK